MLYRAEFGTDDISNTIGNVRFPESYPFMPMNGVAVVRWETPVVCFVDGGEGDYASSNIGARVVSAKLRSLICEFSIGQADIQWLPVSIDLTSGREEYYAFHFSQCHSVVDSSRSKFLSTGALITPVFKKKIVADLPLFAIPGKSTFEFFARCDLVAKIVSAGISGIMFKEIPEERLA